MPKNRVPDLADWQIRHSETSIVHAVVRATSIEFHGGWAVLTDTSGQPLHSVSPSSRLTIRRLEPGDPREVPPVPFEPAPEPAPEPPLPRRTPGKKTR